MSLESRLTYPQIRYGHWGIADLTAFKLQWIGSDRNIDDARKVWVGGAVIRRSVLPEVADSCTLSRLKRILLK
jgi:hypothetical protein